MTTIDECTICGRTASNHSNPNTDYRGINGDAPPTDHYYFALDDGVESKASEDYWDYRDQGDPPDDWTGWYKCRTCGKSGMDDGTDSMNTVDQHRRDNPTHRIEWTNSTEESKASETQDDFDWLNEDDDRFTATMWEQSDGTWIVNSEGSQYDSSFTARFTDSVDAHKYMDKVNRGELTKDDLYNDEMSGYRILESKASEDWDTDMEEKANKNMKKQFGDFYDPNFNAMDVPPEPKQQSVKDILADFRKDMEQFDESKASEYSIKEEFDLQDQDGKYEMLSKADLSVADATNYSTYSHSELPEEVKDSLKGDEDSFGESWSRKSSIDKIEALERLGIKQGDAIKLSGVEFEDFGEDLQGALKGDVEDARNRMKAQKAFLNKTEDDQNPTGFNNQIGGEVDNPNSEFGQNYPDYNKIGESQTSMTKYECEHCNLGFKSNESLSRHHRSIHKIASEDIDGYSVDAGFTGQNSFTDMSSISKEDVTQEWWNNVATPSSKARILNSTGTPVENTFGLPSYYELTQETKAYLLGLDDFSFESKANESSWHEEIWDNINEEARSRVVHSTDFNLGNNRLSLASHDEIIKSSSIELQRDNFPNWYKMTEVIGQLYAGFNESKANENKTYTCDKCGKVGDSFTDMAQEECPEDVNANHQIPIFGDQVKPRGIGEEHYSMYFDQAYSDMNDENPITGYKQCEYCDAKFGEYDKQGMIDHANSHDADLDPVTGDSRESKAREGSEDVYNYEYVDDKVVCKNCGMKFDSAIDDARAMKDHSEIHESLYDKEAYAHEDDLDTLMWDNENPDDKGKQWKDKKGKKQESKAVEYTDEEQKILDHNMEAARMEGFVMDPNAFTTPHTWVQGSAGANDIYCEICGVSKSFENHPTEDEMDVLDPYRSYRKSPDKPQKTWDYRETDESKANEDITFADQHRGIQKDMIEFIRRKGGSASELDIDREFDLLNNFNNEYKHLQALKNDGTLTSAGWQPDNSGNDGYPDGSYIYNLNESLANEDVTFGQDNVWSMMTTQQREDAFNRVGLSGIHFNEDDENNWAKYNYGDVEWYELTPKMQDQLNKWGIGESYSSESDVSFGTLSDYLGIDYSDGGDYCKICGKDLTYAKDNELLNHVNSHDDKTLLEGESKASEAGLDDHSCPECGFISSDNSDYIDHLNAHED